MDTKSFITRQEAASLLHVSLRTLDRYIRRKKIKTKREGKNVFILENDVLTLIQDIPVEQEIYKDSLGEDLSDAREEKKEYALVPESATIIFKKLFEEAQRQIEKKEEKIEMLNYKLGQMEAKLKQSIPLLEHKEATLDTTEKIKEQEQVLRSVSQKVKMLTMVKNVYLVLLMILVVMLPFLWFFLFPH
jgi:hypothetical protein